MGRSSVFSSVSLLPAVARGFEVELSLGGSFTLKIGIGMRSSLEVARRLMLREIMGVQAPKEMDLVGHVAR